jgi:sulfoxide reductase heme-binding subunit YedZ
MTGKIKRKNPWYDVLWFSIPLVVYFGLYHSMVSGNPVTIREFLVKGVTHTGLILIALSLLLGNIAKFWNRYDKFLHYRKQLGIIGFYYVFAHGNIATALYLWDDPSLFREQWISFIAGLLSLYVLGVCMEISEIWAIRKLGSKRWRRTIRYLSYTAFILALLHIGWIRWEEWWRYFLQASWYLKDGALLLPQLSLLTFIFSGGVVIFRIYVAIYDVIDTIKKQRESLQDSLESPKE